MASFDQGIRFRIVTSYMPCAVKVLDVGCSYGIFGQFLEFNGCKVFYLDITGDLLKLLKNRDRIVASGYNLPFRSDTFDFVTSIDVLEHVPYTKRVKFLSELFRVCNSQMIFTFSQVHHNNPVWSGILIFEKLLKITKTPFPEWYNEHNAQIMPTLSKVLSYLAALNITNYDTRGYQGLLGLFLLGLTRITCMFKLLNLLVYIILQVIDIPPYYSFVFRIKKTKRLNQHLVF